MRWYQEEKNQLCGDQQLFSSLPSTLCRVHITLAFRSLKIRKKQLRGYRLSYVWVRSELELVSESLTTPCCDSAAIGLIGIINATLLDEFMNVVQKERAKFQVLFEQ